MEEEREWKLGDCFSTGRRGRDEVGIPDLVRRGAMFIPPAELCLLRGIRSATGTGGDGEPEGKEEEGEADMVLCSDVSAFLDGFVWSGLVSTRTGTVLLALFSFVLFSFTFVSLALVSFALVSIGRWGSGSGCVLTDSAEGREGFEVVVVAVVVAVVVTGEGEGTTVLVVEGDSSVSTSSHSVG